MEKIHGCLDSLFRTEESKLCRQKKLLSSEEVSTRKDFRSIVAEVTLKIKSGEGLSMQQLERLVSAGGGQQRAHMAWCARGLRASTVAGAAVRHAAGVMSTR